MDKKQGHLHIQELPGHENKCHEVSRIRFFFLLMFILEGPELCR